MSLLSKLNKLSSGLTKIQSVHCFSSGTITKFLPPSHKKGPCLTHLPTHQVSLRRLMCAFKMKPFASPKSIARFHVIDSLSPKSFTLIYKSDFQWYLIIAQIGVLLTIGAFVVVLTTAYVERNTPAETKRETNLEIRSRMIEKDAIARKEKRIAIGSLLGATDDNLDIVENVPSAADMISEDAEYIIVFLSILALLGLSIFKLLTMLPIRIYVGKKNHCVSIYYGSLIPGRTVRQEFVAGTLRPTKSFGAPNTCFKEGSGRTMMMFEHFFRRPADFNYILGITKSFEFEENLDEMSQLKNVGSFGSNRPKKK